MIVGVVCLLLVIAVRATDNLYEVLGVSRDASESEIKRAYKKLARELHPDAKAENSNEEIRKRFIAVSAAYEVLGDSKRRESYDNTGRKEDSPESQNYLKHNLFADNFDGEQLRCEDFETLTKSTAFVFMWAPNYPECIEAAKTIRVLATRLKTTRIRVATIRCDECSNVCRTLRADNLPSAAVMHRGKVEQYTKKLEVQLIVEHMSAVAIGQKELIRNAMGDSLAFQCTNPASSINQVPSVFLTETSKRCYLGSRVHDFVAFEYSKCYDCEIELRLTLFTLAAMFPMSTIVRVDCTRPLNEGHCEQHGERTLDQAWTIKRIEIRCWYAMRSPFNFSHEECESPQYKVFGGKHSNANYLKFITRFADSAARSMTVDSMQEMTNDNNAYAILQYDSTKSDHDDAKALWELSSRRINVYTPIITPKKNRIVAGTIDCSKHGSHCVGSTLPSVALYGYGTKVKAKPPVLFSRILSMDSMITMISREAEPLKLHVLTPATYDAKINGGLALDFSWFVLYNAGTWCPPCNAVRPVWKEVARLIQRQKVSKKLKVAVVECDEHRDLCNGLNIEGYPTMKFFAKGKSPAVFQGERDAHSLSQWATELVDNPLLSLAPNVLWESFHRGETVLVSFTAGNWCPPCTSLKPLFRKIASQISRIPVTQVDCDHLAQFCNQFGVTGYPTISLLKGGKIITFDGERDERSILAWANSKI